MVDDIELVILNGFKGKLNKKNRQEKERVRLFIDEIILAEVF